MSNPTKQEVVKFWLNAAKRDLQTTEMLFKNKRYDACLFFCHLVIEKALKGLVVKNTNNKIPFTHNLKELAKITHIELHNDLLTDLAEIATFNVEGRYDNIKRQFYYKATKEYTDKYLHKTKEIFTWLKKQF